jgi:hypothetical protein
MQPACACRGFTFSFGLFQSYYELDLLSDESPSDVSWIGTVASYLLIVIGVVSGPLFDLGYYKVMLFGGATMTCFGIMMLSLSKTYYQIMLTQGICMGLGCGVLYIPGIALVSRSFSARRAMALGLVTCGAPFGKFDTVHNSAFFDRAGRRDHLHHHFRPINQLPRVRMDGQGHGLHHDNVLYHRISSPAVGSGQPWRHQFRNGSKVVRQGCFQGSAFLDVHLCQLFRASELHPERAMCEVG